MEIEQSSVITYNKNKIEPKRLENRVNNLIDCYQTGELCDVTLVAGINKCRIAAHRLILSTANPYFRAMFTNDHRERDSQEIVLKEIHGDELKILIDYCYTGYIEINHENVYRILETASRMEFVDVERDCSDFLQTEISPATCLTIWTSIEPFLNFKQLTEKALKCAQENFSEVSDTHEFLLLDSDHLFTLLSSDNLDVWSEEEVFSALVKWVNYDEKARNEKASKLITAIRLTHLTLKFLHQNVKEFCEKYNCNDLIKDVCLWKAFPKDQPDSYAPRKSTTMNWLIAIGNVDVDDSEQRNSEIYSPFTNKWRIHKKVMWDCVGSSFIIANGELYILGGFNAKEEKLNTVQKYNFVTNEMTEVAPMKTKRCYFSAAVLNNKIYVSGLKCVESFDLNTEKWSEESPMLETRRFHKLVALKGRLFVIGGLKDKDQFLKSVECYDPFENKWQSKASMNSAHCGHQALVHNNEIYVVGGIGDTGAEGTVERYDPLLDKWTIIDQLKFPFYEFSSTSSDECFIFAGGMTSAHDLQSSVYEIDFNSFGKKQIASMKYKRRSFGLFEIPAYNPNLPLK